MKEKNVRHIQTRIERTDRHGIIEETNVFLPKSKQGKLTKFGKDYSVGSTYKVTNEDGSMSFSDNENVTNNIRLAKKYEKPNKKVVFDRHGRNITKGKKK